MATAKKAPVKKTTISKSATIKKAPVKKVAKVTAVKKTVSKPTSKVAAKPAKMRSFRLSPNEPSFKTFKITRQTLYWIILVAYIVFMQLWILSLQIQTSNYIETELNSISSGE